MTLPFGFTAPQLLLLLVPAVLLTLLLSGAARHHQGLGRRRVALVIRVVLLGLIVFALAGLQWVWPVDKLTTVFVLDLSDSVGTAGRTAAVEFVRQAIETKKDGDRAGIVAFGGDALVERLPDEVTEMATLASVPVKGSTDIGGALRLAAALFPDETQKRIVLVSDGNDTTGHGASEAALAAARGVQVETHTVGELAADEVILERLQTPSAARVGEEIVATVTISSSVRQPATVRLFDGAAQIAERVTTTLEPGSNTVTFRTTATEAGFHAFRVLVEAGRDTFAQNNVAASSTMVQGDPRILVVAGDEDVAGNLVTALEREQQDVSLVVPEAAPDTLTGLAAYDSVVLVDAPRTRLNEDQMLALQAFTRDLGRGLVMIGGPRSYGAGGYKQTPLEEALPVEMDVRDREKQPDVALVVVIDKSGSMDACHCNVANREMGVAIQGVPKVDIGKEAILRAVAALTPRDEFGVVAFNENAHWVIHTEPLASVGDVEAQIAGIKADGQTNIFAGLSEAVASLEKTAATRRHIVLLTDGWSRSGDYTALIERMKTAGITLSTVGAGGGSADVLRQLAEQGGGRYYPAANPASIPDIFLKETQQVSGQQIVEEAFFPVQTGSSPILDGLEAGLPRLLGYNGTTAKAAAETILATSRDDPLLAQWQYGLGRSVAWTSDATGRWAKGWVGWQGFDRFFSQLVRWTFPGEETGGIEAEFLTDGDAARLRVTSAESDGTPRDFYDTAVTIVDPELDQQVVQLEQVAPGVYEAPLGTLKAGAYGLRVLQKRAGVADLGRTLGLVAPTPAEYRQLGVNEALLTTLRAATGGRSIMAPEEVWTHDLRSTAFATDLWPLLLVLALLLFPVDVGLRRVSISRRELAAGRAWFSSRVLGRGQAARPEAVGGMLAAKERAAGSSSRAALVRPTRSPARASSDAGASGDLEGVTTRQSGTQDAAVPSTATTAAPSAERTEPVEADTLARLREAKKRAQR